MLFPKTKNKLKVAMPDPEISEYPKSRNWPDKCTDDDDDDDWDDDDDDD